MKTRGTSTPRRINDFIYEEAATQRLISNTGDDSGAVQKEVQSPLCKCPTCDKTFASLRSLFGHFASHSKEGFVFNREQILFACPFCPSGDTLAIQAFGPLEQIEAHVKTCHQRCELRASSDFQNNTEATVDLNSSYPLCKCPNCDKVLSQQALFGHFGRVHSGQLGHTSRFDWKKVVFYCPFCNSEEGVESIMFPNIEDAEFHVIKTHPKCQLIRPVGLQNTSEEKDASLKGGFDSYFHNRKFNTQPTEKADTLYACPECRKSFTKRGLSTHFGMVHNSLLDWKKVEFAHADEEESSVFNRTHEDESLEEHEEGEDTVNQPRKSSRILKRTRKYSFEEDDGGGGSESPIVEPSIVSTLNFGPWTSEEHVAFLIGHEKYGNQWTRISEEFVPTRTSKQIGSHALAHFSALGKWGGRSAAKRSRMTEEDEGVNIQENSKPVRHILLGIQKEGNEALSENKSKSRSVVAVDKCISDYKSETSSIEDAGIKRNAWTAEEHSAFIEGHKNHGNSWLLISEQYVPTRTPKQVGSHAFHYFNKNGHWDEAKKEKPDPSIYKDDRFVLEEEALRNRPDDDGNFDYCIVCEDGGELNCCSNCPRSYHSSCLANKGSQHERDELPPNWMCEHCKYDSMILPEEEISSDTSRSVIFSVYSKFKEYPDFDNCCNILFNISQILMKLKHSDFGYIFSDPVDCDIAPDYLDVIQSPMDYGTVLTKLETGEYGHFLTDTLEEKTPMETILLRVIRDIELVHSNCLLYNRNGSSLYRAGQTQSKKWNAFFDLYISDFLPVKAIKRVHSETTPAIDPTAVCLEQLSNGTQAQEQSTQKALKKQPQEKHEEYQHRGEEKHEGFKHKNALSSFSALLLTKEQLKALENVFFSSPMDLISSARKKSKRNDQGYFLSQWYDRLEDLKNHKISHGTAVVSISIDDNLYQWKSRQRKRYHLTLFHKPHYKSLQNMVVDCKENDSDAIWLKTMPSMTGIFSLDNVSPARIHPIGLKGDKSDVPELVQELTEAETDDIELAKTIQEQHQNQLYHPKNSSPPYPPSSSLFWDECVEDLRFFHGDHKHTLVPRMFPHNKYLSLWVEIQRAKLLLQLVGIDSGMLGSQLFVLDEELTLCDFSESPLAIITDTNGTCSSSHDNKTVHDSDIVDEIKSGLDNKLKSSDHCSVHTQPENSLIDYRHQLTTLSKVTAVKSFFHSKDDAKHNCSTKEKKSQLPLCKCTHCDKFFLSLKKLYGHFGSAHSRSMGLKIDRSNIMFGCPFCLTDDPDGSLKFQPLATLKAHVKLCHPTCELLSFECQVPSIITTSRKVASDSIGKRQKSNISIKTTSLLRKSVFQQRVDEFASSFAEKGSSGHKNNSKDLSSWYKKQSLAASAFLCGTPNVSGVKMSIKKVKLLASAGIFHAFPYNQHRVSVGKEDCEGSKEWEDEFDMLQSFSIRHGSTLIPKYYDCNANVRSWMLHVKTELLHFINGEFCELSTQQIEKLTLIGFCSDRCDLPNLNRSDVMWFKKFNELKRYQVLFGDCHVTPDYPLLYEWIQEQKKLVRLFRMGKKELFKEDRMKMLSDAGVDFFLGDCCPYLVSKDELRNFEQLASMPSEHFLKGKNTTFATKECYNLSGFESTKILKGHSLLIASENRDLYQWFIEMRSLLLDSYACQQQSGRDRKTISYHLCGHSILSYFKDREEIDNCFNTTESFLLWTKYCERFIMFKAHEGHHNIPSDYPDIALMQWVSKQQDDIYMHCTTKQPLPLHLKVLISLGIKGKKRRDKIPKMSSRTFKYNPQQSSKQKARTNAKHL